jgi:hypothetical protein
MFLEHPALLAFDSMSQGLWYIEQQPPLSYVKLDSLNKRKSLSLKHCRANNRHEEWYCIKTADIWQRI